MVVEPKPPQDKTSPRPELYRSVVDLHLWQITPVRDMFWIGLGVMALLFTYYLRSIFTPVLIGLLLAYIFNPLISYFEERWRVPRPVTISALLILLTILLVGLVAWVVPMLYYQTVALLNYALVQLEQRHLIQPGSFGALRTLAALPQGNPQEIAQTVLSWISEAFGYIGTVIETSTYVVLTLMLIPIYFFSFAWQFEPIARRVREHIPPRHRERTMYILRQMDEAVSGFFRGRLIVAFIMSAAFMLGWYLAGVPYWFVLGILAGLLNIVPYLVIIAWPLAVLLKWLTAGAGAAAATQVVATQALATLPAAAQAAASQPITEQLNAFLWVALWPTVAYLVAQFLDNWFITPIVQARSSNLSAVTIIIVVLVGGSLGGLYGLLLAIPVAACVKILGKEVLIPHLHRWAQEE